MDLKDTLDTSRISITAHYTGYVWYENGLSHRALATWQGKAGYYAAAPWMAVAKRVIGADLETILLQRHHLIDHLLHNAIWNQGVTQVVELACGLAPRGMRFMNTYAGQGLRYMETDLPGMVKLKKKALRQAKWSHANHQVLPCNMLEESGESSLHDFVKYLDRHQPTALITEGLINYFAPETIQELWKRIAGFLKNFPYGLYLSDNIPDSTGQPHHFYVRPMKKIVEFIGQGEVYLHGKQPHEIEADLIRAGFSEATVHQPQSYVGSLPIPDSKPGLIQVLAAVV